MQRLLHLLYLLHMLRVVHTAVATWPCTSLFLALHSSTSRQVGRKCTFGSIALEEARAGSWRYLAVGGQEDKWAAADEYRSGGMAWRRASAVIGEAA